MTLVSPNNTAGVILVPPNPNNPATGAAAIPAWLANLNEDIQQMNANIAQIQALADHVAQMLLKPKQLNFTSKS